jgi:hypothetical protein
MLSKPVTRDVTNTDTSSNWSLNQVCQLERNTSQQQGAASNLALHTYAACWYCNQQRTQTAMSMLLASHSLILSSQHAQSEPWQNQQNQQIEKQLLSNAARKCMLVTPCLGQPCGTCSSHRVWVNPVHVLYASYLPHQPDTEQGLQSACHLRCTTLHILCSLTHSS